MIDFQKVKLIIWDLDETLWKGVLSDGTVQIIPENLKLINDLVDIGVVCSICSKNDFSNTKKFLQKQRVWDNFVFVSINWSPKGERVKQIIEEMQLRQPNVLFIDDNNLNLNEVKTICPEIMTAEPSIIDDLIEFVKTKQKKDLNHDRLNQYKVLEKKKEFRATTGSNQEFLKKSNIQVIISNDVLPYLDRIEDLVQRSNQLNFTKIRSSKEELEQFIKKSSNCGIVSVKDNFGDYGIVGFYAFADNKLEHFVFSCRTLGMGVEQYVWHKIGKPSIEPVGEVASKLEGDMPEWINSTQTQKQKKLKVSKNIIIKGPCDMSQMFSFIEPSKNIKTEFVYVGRNGVSIEGGNHTQHIIQSFATNENDKNQTISSLPFGDKKMYTTNIFDSDVDVVVYSLFTDPNLGLYKNKKTGVIVAFGEFTNNLTDESLWNDFINKKLFVANCEFTRENLTKIKEEYEFIGRLSPIQIVDNLRVIFEKLQKHTKLVLILGSEIEYKDNLQQAYADRHKFNKKLNDLVRSWASQEQRLKILDVNKFIESQEDFTNNINHFTKLVYYRMSQELIEIVGDSSLKPRTVFCKIKLAISTFVKKILRKFRLLK